MTAQEAITELLTDKLCLMAVSSHPSLVNVEEIDIAISALEKQIPKKPVDKTLEYDGYYGLCPCCNKVISEYRDFARCWCCGQALDWSDTE